MSNRRIWSPGRLRASPLSCAPRHWRVPSQTYGKHPKKKCSDSSTVKKHPQNLHDVKTLGWWIIKVELGPSLGPSIQFWMINHDKSKNTQLEFLLALRNPLEILQGQWTLSCSSLRIRSSSLVQSIAFLGGMDSLPFWQLSIGWRYTIFEYQKDLPTKKRFFSQVKAYAEKLPFTVEKREFPPCHR